LPATPNGGAGKHDAGVDLGLRIDETLEIERIGHGLPRSGSARKPGEPFCQRIRAMIIPFPIAGKLADRRRRRADSARVLPVGGLSRRPFAT